MLAYYLQKLYTSIHKDNYVKEIFDNDIKTSLSTIFSNNKTSISPEIFISAMNKAIQRNQNIIIKNNDYKIIIDTHRGTIELSQKNIDESYFNIEFTLNKDNLTIKTNNQKTYRDGKIFYETKELFSIESTLKDEISYFHLPEEYKQTDNKVKILYTTALNSINKALGTEKLDDDDLDWLLDGKRLETLKGYAYFDKDDSLKICSKSNLSVTKESYICDENKVIYQNHTLTKNSKETHINFKQNESKKISIT